jgi:hypothetical protein
MENEINVWILEGDLDYEGQRLLGVYSSEDKALKAKAEYRENGAPFFDYDIYELVMDE